MSVPLLLMINIGAAALVTLALTALMLLPQRLRAHQHPRQEHQAERPRMAMPVPRRGPRTERSHAAARVVTDH
jgi:hypothetical protein